MTIQEVKTKLESYRIPYEKITNDVLRVYLGDDNNSYTAISISEFGQVICYGRVMDDEEFERWCSI